ncbi:hypothetical protein MRX96_010028 [Rhipicephalus microplus]
MESRTIVNYLALKALLMFSPLPPPNSEDAVATLLGRLLDQLPWWRLCLRATKNARPFAFLGMYHDVFVKERNVLQLRASLSKMKDLLAVSLEDVVWLNSEGRAQGAGQVEAPRFRRILPPPG